MTIEASADSPLSKYFAAVDGGDFDAAVAQFSEHALYVVPSAPASVGGGASTVYRGRSAIAGYFAKRGPRTLRHKLRRLIQQGDFWVVEGAVETDPGCTALFVSVAELDDGRLIRSYVTLSTVLSLSDLDDLLGP